jgi:hypothetical protein
MEGQLYWQGTGKPGKDLDLAGLVCNNLRQDDPDASKCINPSRGQKGGDTWEYRRGFIDGALDTLKQQREDMRDKFGEL